MHPRRLLSELCAYYRRTARAQDVYVEGSSDARILNREFEDRGHSGMLAYPVDLITIDTVDAHIAVRSNRERLKVLASHLSKCKPPIKGRAVCLIDADFDHYNDSVECSEFLVYTEHADIICFFCSSKNLSYSLTHILGDDVNIDALINNIIDVCALLFRVRHALKVVDPTIGFLEDASEACGVSKQGAPTVSLDLDKLINKLLGPPTNRMELKSAVSSQLDVTLPRSDLNVLQQINGHDFIAVLRKVLIKRGRRRFSGSVPPEAIEALVYGSQHAVRIHECTFFKEIVARLNAPSVASH